MNPLTIFWFRCDLRLKDNAGLFHALTSGSAVLPVFIFDTYILDKLENKADGRVEFIHKTLSEIQEQLVQLGSSLEVFYGSPVEVYKKLKSRYTIAKVVTNHDYEPYAQERDKAISEFLASAGIGFETYKDQVVLEKSEVVKDDGKPYTVFTPYSKKWKLTLKESDYRSYQTEKHFSSFFKQSPVALPTLEEIGFKKSGLVFPATVLKKEVIKGYKENRDFPAIEGTSHFGIHLRFGTISIRELARKTSPLNETYLNELIWREFYHMILWHFPQVGKGKCFKPEYEAIEWRVDEKGFEKWCQGKTGYPIVDAGMRELNTTGYMHNRVRMIVASFLAKHLLIDWRWGEAYFAEKLLDFDLAANNGGWQWAAGCGCDAAPYFRIFNPYLQTQKFDPDLKYIRQWVPELDSIDYPKPIVEHDVARKRCLEVYAKALKK